MGSEQASKGIPPNMNPASPLYSFADRRLAFGALFSTQEEKPFRKFWIPPNTALSASLLHPSTRQVCEDFRKDKGLGFSSWDKNAVIQPLALKKSVWGQRSYENRVYNLPQVSSSLNHGFGPFDKECGVSSTANSETQIALDLARFGSFKASHASRISLEDGEPEMQYGGATPDVTLSLSLPNLGETAASKLGLGSTDVEMAKHLGSLASGSSGGPNSAQLTILYGGITNVYHNIPSDKAKAIMLWAGSESEHPLNLSGAPYWNKHEEPSMPNNPLSTHPAVHKALPQARKASLARFLEKRKERIRTKIPYNKTNSPEHTFSHGETQLSTNCGAACSPDDEDDEKMGEGTAEHDSHQPINISLALDA